MCQGLGSRVNQVLSTVRVEGSVLGGRRIAESSLQVFFFFFITLEPEIQKSMRLKCEPSSEPLHRSVRAQCLRVKVRVRVGG